jgi:hypothetical protein
VYWSDRVIDDYPIILDGAGDAAIIPFDEQERTYLAARTRAAQPPLPLLEIDGVRPTCDDYVRHPRSLHPGVWWDRRGRRWNARDKDGIQRGFPGTPMGEIRAALVARQVRKRVKRLSCLCGACRLCRNRLRQREFQKKLAILRGTRP